MKIFAMFILILGITVNAYSAKPPQCEVPLSMTFLDTTSAPHAIWNDDPYVPYQNGVGGMNINIKCPTHDAVMVFGASRQVWMQFPEPIPGSIIEGGPLSFAGGPALLLHPGFFLNVRNLTGGGSGVKIPGPAATYYTKAAFQFDGPDGVHYRMGFMPDDSTCPANAFCVPNIHGDPFPTSVNLPQQSAWVKVTYTPQPNHLDQFLVEGEFTTASDPEIQRAGLFTDVSWIHQGQYSMPFKILYTTLSPLAPFIPSISVDDVSVIEGNSGTQNVTFTVKIDAAVDSSVSVKYATANDTAKSTSDYTSKSGTLTIPAGATSTTVTIAVKGDTVVEPDETFFVNLSQPVNAEIVDDQGVCTIVNND